MDDDELLPMNTHCEVCGELLETRKEKTKGVCIEHWYLFEPTWNPQPLDFGGEMIDSEDDEEDDDEET